MRIQRYKQIRTRIARVLAVAVWTAAGVGAEARGDTNVTWNNSTGDGLYSTANNWAPAQVPNNNSTLYTFTVSTASPIGPTIAGGETVDGGTIQHGTNLNIVSEEFLSIENGGTLTLDGMMTINSDGGPGQTDLNFIGPGNSSLLGAGFLTM